MYGKLLLLLLLLSLLKDEDDQKDEVIQLELLVVAETNEAEELGETVIVPEELSKLELARVLTLSQSETELDDNDDHNDEDGSDEDEDGYEDNDELCTSLFW